MYRGIVLLLLLLLHPVVNKPDIVISSSSRRSLLGVCRGGTCRKLTLLQTYTAPSFGFGLSFFQPTVIASIGELPILSHVSCKDARWSRLAQVVVSHMFFSSFSCWHSPETSVRAIQWLETQSFPWCASGQLPYPGACWECISAPLGAIVRNIGGRIAQIS